MTDTTIEYKVGEIDTIGGIIFENGTPVNLTDSTVSFIMKGNSSPITLTCTLGGYVNGQYVSPDNGGVTINITDAATATAGQYLGEFIVSKNGYVARPPSGNNFITITIWEALL